MKTTKTTKKKTRQRLGEHTLILLLLLLFIDTAYLAIIALLTAPGAAFLWVALFLLLILVGTCVDDQP